MGLIARRARYKINVALPHTDIESRKNVVRLIITSGGVRQEVAIKIRRSDTGPTAVRLWVCIWRKPYSRTQEKMTKTRLCMLRNRRNQFEALRACCTGEMGGLNFQTRCVGGKAGTQIHQWTPSAFQVSSRGRPSGPPDNNMNRFCYLCSLDKYLRDKDPSQRGPSAAGWIYKKAVPHR